MVPDTATWCRPDWDILVCPIRAGGRDATPFVPKNSDRLSGAFFEGFALDLAIGLGGGSRHRKSSGEKKPRVSGAEVGGTSNVENRICGTIDNSRLARPSRSLCDGDHKECGFAA